MCKVHNFFIVFFSFAVTRSGQSQGWDVVPLRFLSLPCSFWLSVVSISRAADLSLSYFLQCWSICSLVWSSSKHGRAAHCTNLSLFMYVSVHPNVSCVQSYHHHLLWPTKRVISILLLTWHHTRFGNGGLFLVAHISTWLFCLCTFHCELVCLLINRNGRVSTEGPLCSSWAVAEDLLNVAIWCWSGVVKMRAHLWEIHPWCSSGFESTAREMAFTNASDCCIGCFCAAVREEMAISALNEWSILTGFMVPAIPRGVTGMPRTTHIFIVVRWSDSRLFAIHHITILFQGVVTLWTSLSFSCLTSPQSFWSLMLRFMEVASVCLENLAPN